MIYTLNGLITISSGLLVGCAVFHIIPDGTEAIIYNHVDRSLCWMSAAVLLGILICSFFETFTHVLSYGNAGDITE